MHDQCFLKACFILDKSSQDVVTKPSLGVLVFLCSLAKLYFLYLFNNVSLLVSSLFEPVYKFKSLC